MCECMQQQQHRQEGQKERGKEHPVILRAAAGVQTLSLKAQTHSWRNSTAAGSPAPLYLLLLPALRLPKTNEQSAHQTVFSSDLFYCKLSLFAQQTWACVAVNIFIVTPWPAMGSSQSDLQPLMWSQTLLVWNNIIVFTLMNEVHVVICLLKRIQEVVILFICSLCVSSGLLSGHDRVGGQTEDKCPHQWT